MAEQADQVAYLLSTLPIQFVPVDIELAKKAAEVKAAKKVFYADCFAAALARLRKAELVTGDKEFKQAEDMEFSRFTPAPSGPRFLSPG